MTSITNPLAELEKPAVALKGQEGKLVDVYSPDSGGVVQVPAEQAKLLTEAGYSVGPSAEYQKRVEGWEGKLASGILGIARTTSLGAADFAVPKSLLSVQKEVEKVHPHLKLAGEIAGGVPALALTGGAGAALLPEHAALTAAATRVVASAAEGSVNEAARARKFNEPINAERVLMAGGVSGLFGLAGEGVLAASHAVVPAAKRALGKLGEYWPMTDAKFRTVKNPEDLAAKAAFETERDASLAESKENVRIAEDAHEAAKDARASMNEKVAKIRTDLVGERDKAVQMTRDELALAKRAHQDIPKNWEGEIRNIDQVEQPSVYRPLLGDIKDTAKASGLATLLGHGQLGGAAAVIGAADNGITLALNHLDTVHSLLDRVVSPIAVGTGQVARALLERPHELDQPEKLGDVDGKYEKISQAVQNFSDPGAFQDYLDVQHGHLGEEHPQLYQEFSTRAQMVAGALNSLLPKQPGEPSLMAEKFNPPRSAKIKFIRAFNTLNDPLTALTSLTPDKVKLLDMVYPETMNLVRNTVSGYLIRNKDMRLSTAQKRYLTYLMGSPMSRTNDPGYLKRLQETVAQPPPPPGAGPSGSGPAPSAKISQAGVLQDATNAMKLGMGF